MESAYDNGEMESELGTQEYWDDAYSMELKNFTDHGDVGDIWFGEDSLFRVIRWLQSCNEISKSDSILDLGCGNGMTLVELAREGYSNLTGVDYSEAAIKLATDIAKKQELDIKYQVCDMFDEQHRSTLDKSVLILDKGTYDAICLEPNQGQQRSLEYVDIIHDHLLSGDVRSRLVLTSCNWTQEELVNTFQKHFELDHVIPTPQFKFGGKVGNLVTSLVFKRKASSEQSPS